MVEATRRVIPWSSSLGVELRTDNPLPSKTSVTKPRSRTNSLHEKKYYGRTSDWMHDDAQESKPDRCNRANKVIGAPETHHEDRKLEYKHVV